MLLIFGFSGCNFNYPEPEVLKDGYILDKFINIERFKEYYYIEYKGKNASVFDSNNILFAFIGSYHYVEYDIKEKNKKYRKDDIINMLIIINNLEKRFILFDNILFEHYKDTLFLTQDYQYFFVWDNGLDIYREPVDNFVSKIILFSKNDPETPALLEYELQQVLTAKQVENNFYVKTVILEPEIWWLGKQLNEHISRVSIGKFEPTDEYFEYIYNSDLECISKKKIKKD